jgi:protease-4
VKELPTATPDAFRRAGCALAGAALLLALDSAASAVAGTPEPPPLLYGDESVAATDGARGMLFNPAAVGVRYPSELVVSWSRFGNESRVSHGLLSLGGFGLMAQRVRDQSHAYGFSLAGGGGACRAGLTSVWRVNTATHETKPDHRLGVLSRPAPWLSLGATADHLFQPGFEDRRLGREYTLGVGLRPLALNRRVAHSLGTRVTLTTDVLLAEDGEWSRARVRVGGEIEPLPGIALRGSVEDHGGLHLAVGLSGPRWGLHAQRASVDGDRRHDTCNLSIHSGDDRSVLVSRADRRVATIRAGGRLGDDRLSGVTIFGGVSTTPSKGLHEQLERALEDPLTLGVLLELDGVSGMAQLEELRPRIVALRERHKPVVAYLENGAGRGDLYLASACDRIVTTREASFVALGLRAERRYYRQMLAAWGLRMDRSSFGAYKSAFRNFSVDSMPPADREVIEHNLDMAQELFVSTVADARRMDRGRLLTLLDGRYRTAKDVQQAGLVDSIGYREDALRILGELAALGSKPRAVKLASVPPARREWTVPTRIAVVYASGAIETGESGNDLFMGPTMGAATTARQIERAFKAPGVKAVVLRVESPGGSGLASDLIDHALTRMKRATRKPLIVSMGGVAASGGYHISVHGDRIFADRFTVTGSIGVLTVKPSLEGFYRRHDVKQEELDRGRFMRGTSLARDWDQEMQASADSMTYADYSRFVAHCAEGRGLSWDQVHEVAQGRPWMGEDARARRLVDEIGGLDAALAEARRRAGIPPEEKIRFAELRRPRPGWLRRVVGEAMTEAWERSARMPEPGELLHWADDAEAP